MSADETVLRALRDDILWSIDQRQGDQLTSFVASSLAVAVAQNLADGFDVTPHDRADALLAVIRGGLVVRRDEVITAELAQERASNICQAIVGLFDVGFADERTEPMAQAWPIAEARR